MSNNLVSDPLSDRQVIAYARQLRRYHGLNELEVPDVLALLSLGKILTRFGEKELLYLVVPDCELGENEGITIISETRVRIRLSKTTYERAVAGNGRSRMTVAHEFMHGLLHKNRLPLSRGKIEEKRFVKHFVSVEHQAKVGASAYLITDAMVRNAISPAELSKIALVSFSAADIRWKEEQQKLRRNELQAGFKALVTELKSFDNRPDQLIKNALICPGCGQITLVPIGIRYLCVGPCDRPFDVADGDGPFIP